MKTNDKKSDEWLRLEKIEAAYQKFSKILIAEVCKNYHITRHSAEDIVQTTFERVIKYGHNFTAYDDKSAFRFLYTIMKHEAYCLLKDLKKNVYAMDVPQILEELSISTANVSNNPEFLYVERTIVREAIKKLPPHYSSVLYLHYYYGYKFKEIADFLGISENTAIQRNHYIRQKLREILIKEGFRDETQK